MGTLCIALNVAGQASKAEQLIKLGNQVRYYESKAFLYICITRLEFNDLSIKLIRVTTL